MEDHPVTQPDQQADECTAEQIADAQAAYAAYGQTTGGKNFRGEPMPDWDRLGDTIQRAWIAAASTVRDRAERRAGLGTGSRPWWEARLEQMCEWARANGLDPDDIPARAEFVVHGGKVTVDVVARRADGSIAVDRGRPLLTKKAVPLRVPFPD